MPEEHDQAMRALFQVSDEHERAIASLLYVIRHADVTLDRSKSFLLTLASLCRGLRIVWERQNAFNVITFQAGGGEVVEVIHNFEGRHATTRVTLDELFSRLKDPGSEA